MRGTVPRTAMLPTYCGSDKGEFSNAQHRKVLMYTHIDGEIDLRPNNCP